MIELAVIIVMITIRRGHFMLTKPNDMQNESTKTRSSNSFSFLNVRTGEGSRDIRESIKDSQNDRDEELKIKRH